MRISPKNETNSYSIRNRQHFPTKKKNSFFFSFYFKLKKKKKKKLVKKSGWPTTQKMLGRKAPLPFKVGASCGGLRRHLGMAAATFGAPLRWSQLAITPDGIKSDCT
jgi:hypothetical protein